MARRTRLTIVLLALVSLSASRVLSQGNERRSGAGEVHFKLIHDFLIVVPGRIGDLTGLKFILDTGTSHSMVSRKLARRLGVQLHRERVFDFTEFVQIESGVFAQVEFGPIQLTNVAMLVADLPRISAFTTEADALIGTDLLTLNNFSIDYDAKKILFTPSERSTRSASLNPVGLILELDVQGQQVDVLVDTGVEGVVLFENRLRSRMPPLRMIEGTTEVTVGGIHAKSAILPDAHLGPNSINPRVLLVKDPPANVLPGIDGSWALHH